MSQIKVTNLTFGYDGSYDNIFENTSFQIDTDWRLGFIGRNGKGKTTFLKLLMGEYEYKGSIYCSVSFDYFPYETNDEFDTLECLEAAVGEFNDWELITEINKLNVDAEVLYRPFKTLSSGERTKVMLGALFIKGNNFLLIDEPTNHLDIEGREVLANYLKSKKSFILVSHDRAFLDKSIDHVLSINKNNIEIQKGNYSTWQYNKELEDRFEEERNEGLKKDIKRLKVAAERTAKWSDKTEAGKIGSHAADRGYVGHMAAKAMKRSKSIERRQKNAISEKETLLKNIDSADSLKMNFLEYPKKNLIFSTGLIVEYGGKRIFQNVDLSVNRGERIAVKGKNGAGKSSLLKLILKEYLPLDLKVSYVCQDTSHLKGSLKEFAAVNGINQTLFMTILRHLGFSRTQLEKNIEFCSMGQRKKVLLAKSLSEEAHLYVWDEPLNYIDVLSRIQIEEVLIKYKPTMIFVEHDKVFSERVATKILTIE